MGMSIPYEMIGRTNQKARTRGALLDATRELLAEGVSPTVEQAADRAAVSRTTAYRYFANQRALLTAVYPEIEANSLLDADAPVDPEERLELVIERFTRHVLEHEGALAPLRERMPAPELRRLVLAIRATTGIEAFVWLTDIAGLPREEAAELMRSSARALLRDACREGRVAANDYSTMV